MRADRVPACAPVPFVGFGNRERGKFEFDNRMLEGLAAASSSLYPDATLTLHSLKSRLDETDVGPCLVCIFP